MKKTWIGLTLAAALCLSLAGCAGDKTGGEITPGASTEPTAQTTPTAAPEGAEGNGVTDGDASNAEEGTDAANGGSNSGEALEGNENTRMGTTRASGRADNSALERMGDGIKDTLDDMGAGARRMAQDAKRAME